MGLAAIGPAGAIGGLATLALAPAIASNIAVSKFLEDDEKLSVDEREARSAGRAAAKIGAVADPLLLSKFTTLKEYFLCASATSASLFVPFLYFFYTNRKEKNR